MIRIRETEEDLRKQKRLFEVFSKQKKLYYSQFSSFSKKYRIDGFCYDQNKNIKCWVECKWYNNNAHCYLNVPKFKELIDLSETTLLPSYFLFREYDRWGYIMIHDGFNIVCKYNTKLTGGTPNGREANPDDIEPIIVLNKENIIWGN